MGDKRRKRDTADRLTDRLERDEIRHQSMAGGKGVYRGELATRALESVGARAMTLDRSVIVSDDFDPSRPQDQALFAHEMYHAEHGDGGGGGGGDNFRDAEEIAARAVERLALHRATAGGFEVGHRPHESGSGTQSDHHRAVAEQARQETQTSEKSESAPPDASQGYQALRSEGYSHDEVILQLTQKIMSAIQEEFQAKGQRGGHLKGTI